MSSTIETFIRSRLFAKNKRPSMMNKMPILLPFFIFFSNQAMLCSTGFLHFSSGVAPQKLQDSPSLFKRGLLLAQVPENSPSFFKIILIAIPAKQSAKRPIERRIVFML